MEHKRLKTFVALGIIIAVISLFFPLAAYFAIRVPDPIYINDEDDFARINDNLDGYYVLNKAVKFSKPVTPIGDKDHPFTGRFDCATGVSGHSLNNVVIDFSTLELEKYTYDNNVYIGLFAFNDGIIIHNVFNDIRFENFYYDGENDLYIGGLVGLNKGKITSNHIFQIDNISFTSNTNIYFGGCAGLNVGDIRRNSFTKHFECNISCNKLSIGEFAGQCGNKSIVEMCSVGSNIHIYNSNIGQIKQLDVGFICGTFTGGLIRNNIFRSPTIDIMNRSISLVNCGGIVGTLTGENKTIIKDCYFNASIRSNGVDLQNNSFVCGSNSSDNALFENLLIGGYLSTYNASCDLVHFADIPTKLNSQIKNCYILDNANLPDSTTRNISNVVNIRDVTLYNMNWSDSIWYVSDGNIVFKA